MRITSSIPIAAIALMSIALVGCGTSADKNAHDPPSPDKTSNGTDEDHAGHGAHASTDAGKQSEMKMAKAELAKLSPEDAASAEKQHVCPVSGEMLGTMGAPEKIDVNGRQVWICCDGCKDQLLASPDKYLATLKKE